MAGRRFHRRLQRVPDWSRAIPCARLNEHAEHSPRCGIPTGKRGNSTMPTFTRENISLYCDALPHAAAQATVERFLAAHTPR
jgi:hypothetical protein